MNTEAFQQARSSYKAGDYDAALEGFILCTCDLDQMGAADISKLYHLIGNCYIKKGDSAQGADYYRRALNCAPEDTKAALNANLGTALLNTRQYEAAVQAFDEALSYDTYKTPYKAYSGRGAAYLRLGDTVEAGASFREAALDPENPKPAKALVNLGVCFMQLDRPADAAVSYESALDFNLDPISCCKTKANLGQAYLAEGRVDEALEMFEEAESFGYELSSAVQHDYEIARSIHEVETRNNTARQALSDEALPAFGAEAAVAGVAAEAAEAQAAPADPSQTPTVEFPSVEAAATPAPQETFTGNETQPLETYSYQEPGASIVNEPVTAPEEASLPSPESTDFFDLSEQQIDSAGREEARTERKKRGVGLKITIVVLIVVIVLLAAAAAAFFLGFGYPLQEDVVDDFMSAAIDDGDTNQYWDSEVDEATRASQLSMLEGVSSYEVVAVKRSTTESSVYVQAQLEAGGNIYYDFVLGRDGIGWQVEYVELYFPSQQ